MSDSARMVPVENAGDVAAFSEKVMRAAAGAFEIYGIFIGDQLGYYEALAAGGPMTAPELAKRTSVQAALRSRFPAPEGRNRR